MGSRRLHFKVLFLINLHCVWRFFLCSQIELFCFAKHSTSFLPRSLSMLLHLPASLPLGKAGCCICPHSSPFGEGWLLHLPATPPFGEGWLLHLPAFPSLWRRLASIHPDFLDEASPPLESHPRFPQIPVYSSLKVLICFSSPLDYRHG